MNLINSEFFLEFLSFISLAMAVGLVSLPFSNKTIPWLCPVIRER